jgi:hypothetical protein
MAISFDGVTKLCEDCRKVLPLAAFNKDKIKRDGLCVYCKPCMKERVTASKEKDTTGTRANKSITISNFIKTLQDYPANSLHTGADLTVGQQIAIRIIMEAQAGDKDFVKIALDRTEGQPKQTIVQELTVNPTEQLAATASELINKIKGGETNPTQDASNSAKSSNLPS